MSESMEKCYWLSVIMYILPFSSQRTEDLEKIKSHRLMEGGVRKVTNFEEIKINQFYFTPTVFCCIALPSRVR